MSDPSPPRNAQPGAIDEGLLARLEGQVRSVPGVLSATAALSERIKPTRPVHVADILPYESWPLAAEAAASSSSRTSLPTVDAEGPTSYRARAERHGGEFRCDDDPTTVAAVLFRAAAAAPDNGITYIAVDGTTSFQSYPCLLDEALRVLTGLRRARLQPSESVILKCESNRNFITAFWACILGGFLPTPVAVLPSYLESSALSQRLWNAWRLLDEPLILTDASLAGATRGLTDLWQVPAVRVGVVEELMASEAAARYHPSQPDDLVLNLLTSGSTGIPKCVQHRHRSIVAQSSGSARANGFTSAEISLNWMPLDHVGGIVMFHLRDVFVGCQQVNGRIEAFLGRPLLWLDWMDRYQATVTWAPNFAFALVNEQADDIDRGSWNLRRVRHVMSGGEAVVSRTAHRFLHLLARHGLADRAVYPAYGMSETASAIVFSSLSRSDETVGTLAVDKRSLGGAVQQVSPDDPNAVMFTEVGPPIAGVSIRIADRENVVLPEGRIGRLQVTGATMMAGYYRHPEANAESFVGDGWFNTRDVGFILGGRLTITGREKDLIIINGLNYVNFELEAAVEQVDGVEVTMAAACAVPGETEGTEQLAVLFVPTRPDATELVEVVKEIRATLASRVGLQPAFVVPVDRAAFPKTNSGKIQRAELVRALGRGAYNDALRRLDLEEANERTVPSWFFEPVWIETESTSAPVDLEAPLLLFHRADGRALARSLSGRGRPVIGVIPGDTFARLDRCRFQIDPQDRSHYAWLVDAVLSEFGQPGWIVHAWGRDTSHSGPPSVAGLNEAHRLLLYSPLFLIQALEARGRESTRLTIVTTEAQVVRPTDRLDCRKATLVGFVKTLRAEVPACLACHVDLDLSELERHGAEILAELQRGEEPEVAYRGGRRHVRRLRELELPDPSRLQPPLTPGGLYLITGGLGEIGCALGEHLIKACGARLLLLGRTPLPLADASEQGERYRRIRDLGDARYLAVDIEDPAAIRSAVERAEAGWGQRLLGAFHLAGESPARYWQDIESHSLLRESRENFEAMFSAKVFGTLALHEALSDREPLLFALCSSVNGFFGGTSFGAYAAANGFLDGFAAFRSTSFGLTTSLAWTMWNGVGMNRHHPALTAAMRRGFRAIGRRQGIASLVVGLSARRPHVLIGLDASNPDINGLLDRQRPVEPQVVVHVTTGTIDVPQSRLRDAARRVLPDRFPVQFVPREAASGTATSTFEPRSDLERSVADVWSEVLGIPGVPMDGHFFRLGGSSLRAARIMARTNARLGLKEPLRVLYEHPQFSEFTRAIERSVAGMSSDRRTGGVRV